MSARAENLEICLGILVKALLLAENFITVLTLGKDRKRLKPNSFFDRKYLLTHNQWQYYCFLKPR